MTAREHPDEREELMALLDLERDDRLDDAGRARLAELLASATELGDEAQELRRLGELFAAVPAVHAPAGLSDDILGAVRAQRPRGLLMRLAPLLSATAAAALVIGFVLATDRGSPSLPPGEMDVAGVPEEETIALDRAQSSRDAKNEGTRKERGVFGELEEDAGRGAGAKPEADAADDMPGTAPARAPAPRARATSAPADTAAADVADRMGADRMGDGDDDASADNESAEDPDEFRDADNTRDKAAGKDSGLERSAGAAMRRLRETRTPGEPDFWITEVGGARYAVFTDEAAAQAYVARLSRADGAGAASAFGEDVAESGAGEDEAKKGDGEKSLGSAASEQVGRAASPVTVVADVSVPRATFGSRRGASGGASSFVTPAAPSAPGADAAGESEGGPREGESVAHRQEPPSEAGERSIDRALVARLVDGFLRGRRAAAEANNVGVADSPASGPSTGGGGGGPAVGRGGAAGGARGARPGSAAESRSTGSRSTGSRSTERVIVLLVRPQVATPAAEER